MAFLEGNKQWLIEIWKFSAWLVYHQQDPKTSNFCLKKKKKPTNKQILNSQVWAAETNCCMPAFISFSVSVLCHSILIYSISHGKLSFLIFTWIHSSKLGNYALRRCSTTFLRIWNETHMYLPCLSYHLLLLLYNILRLMEWDV